MIPGMNMNSRQMKQAMKKMGIQQDQIAAEQVIIRLADKDILINNPDVSKVNMMGQETYQVVGDAQIVERDVAVDISEEDIDTVVDQTNVTREDAREAIKESNGDLAEAILKLSAEEDDVE